MMIRPVLAAAIALICGLLSAADDEAGKILRPADNSTHKSDQIDVVAIALSGRLQLDGAFITNEQQFPNVLHVTLKAVLWVSQIRHRSAYSLRQTYGWRRNDTVSLF